MDKGSPKTRLFYETLFAIPAARRDSDKPSTDFSSDADVRIDSVRAWLHGAMVGEQNGKNELIVTLVHLGDDTIVSSDNEVFEFQHDSVTTRCWYDPTNVKTAKDIPKAEVFGSQRWPSFRDLVLQARTETSDQVVASIGPFATWRLSVFEEENLDLDALGVKDIAIEFTGASRGFGTTR